MLRARTINHLAGVALLAVAAIPLRAQVPQQQGQQAKQSIVLKGKAPVSNDILKVKLPRPKEGELSNGLHLMVLEDHRAPQIAFQLVIPGAGGFYDAPGATGVASVAATMLREGTPTRNTTQVSEQLETMAALLNFGAGVSSTDATISGLAITEKFNGLFDLMSDVLLNPTFPESELAKYKQRTVAQLTQQRSIPGFLAQELYQKVMMGDHPASRVSMTPDDVKNVTRDQMVAFYQSHYVPDHAAIAFAGDITYEQAKALVESKLAGWKKRGTPLPMATNPGDVKGAKVYLVDRPNSVQTNFVVGAPGIERTNPDFDVLQMMNSVVGGGPTGRLFSHLREEKGYTYGAYSGLSAGKYRGTWTASTDVRSEVTEPALTDLMDEIRQIRDIKVPEKELQDKKRSQIASFALSLESPQQVLGYYMTQWSYKLPATYWDDFPKRVMAVTADQVQAAAKKYLDPSKVQIIAVGDGKKIEDTMKKFGPLEIYDTEGKKKPTLVP